MGKGACRFLMFLAVIGSVGSAVMTFMAVRFHEWGRVLFYGMIALLCIELFVWSILKVKES